MKGLQFDPCIDVEFEVPNYLNFYGVFLFMLLFVGVLSLEEIISYCMILITGIKV